jgi:hypothetical protein
VFIALFVTVHKPSVKRCHDIFLSLTLCQWNPDKVSTLDKSISLKGRNSLGRRVRRQENVLQVIRTTNPAQIALHLRREERSLHEAAMKAAKEGNLADQIAAIEAGNKARGMLLDIIGWPKRPTAPTPKPGRLPPPVDITPAPIQDAQVASPESGI